jgi:NitT/TauT family transport system ATP-binding protein
VTLDVPAGRFLSVVGPSGCGKSTLLGMISGLQPTSGGEVIVSGRPVRDVRTDVGFIFQRDALLPWKTVLDNVALALVFRGTPNGRARATAREWIARVGLAGFEGYYPHQLSGGMRKRVSLAQTLVYDPPIVLMDEPFSALDVQTRNLMENELLQLWAEDRKTVVFITHDLEEAIALSDQVVVMTASPGRVKAVYPIDLPRPRNVTEIRFDPAFGRLYERLWADLRDEVLVSYEHSKARAAG